MGKIIISTQSRHGGLLTWCWTHLIVPESLHLLLIGCLSHLEDQWRLSKPEILSGDVSIQEDVDPLNQRIVIKLLDYSHP